MKYQGISRPSSRGNRSRNGHFDISMKLEQNRDMDRRDFIRILGATGTSFLCGCSTLHSHFKDLVSFGDREKEPVGSDDIAETKAPTQLTPQQMSDELLKDARAKSIYFSQDFPDDIYFKGEKFELLKNVVHKFRGVQRHVGSGNFNLVGMDEFFKLSDVNNEEKKFLEELFYFKAEDYGFYGDKVFTNFTDSIKKPLAYKVPYTGHFLKKGPSLEVYERIKKDVGSGIILTSGVRGMAKQFHLFMEKGLNTNGNMSKASRSLAPPGYSFHGKGDFDIGRVGFGIRNFTDDFAATDEYKKLLDLGYVQIRYTEKNLLGVRFEPWHIKVAES